MILRRETTALAMSSHFWKKLTKVPDLVHSPECEIIALLSILLLSVIMEDIVFSGAAHISFSILEAQFAKTVRRNSQILVIVVRIEKHVTFSHKTYMYAIVLDLDIHSRDLSPRLSHPGL